MKTLYVTLGAAFGLALGLSGPAPVEPLQTPSTASQEAEPRASDPVDAAWVPLPPMEDRVDTTVRGRVYFMDQEGIDKVCGGTDDVIACATVGPINGGFMALPNPNQERFAGESYAAIVAHEMGHTNGWRHGD